MKILLDKLKYHFQWTEFAAKDNFKKAHRCYMAYALGRPAAANINVKMLTPLPNKRTIGKWTLGDTLSASSYRKIFFTSNQSANVAAIKVIEQTS